MQIHRTAAFFMRNLTVTYLRASRNVRSSLSRFKRTTCWEQKFCRLFPCFQVKPHFSLPSLKTSTCYCITSQFDCIASKWDLRGGWRHVCTKHAQVVLRTIHMEKMPNHRVHLSHSQIVNTFAEFQAIPQSIAVVDKSHCREAYMRRRN